MQSAKILVFKEKHGDHYFDASSLDAFLLSCLITVKRRLEEGCFYNTWSFDEVKKPDLSEDFILSLPASETKKNLRKAWDEYRESIKETQENNDLVELAELAVETNDPYLAWRVLNERKEGQYEGFSIERMISPLGIQHIQKRLKMKPSFTVDEAKKMIVRKLTTENIAAIETSERRFVNISSEVFSIGDSCFAAAGNLCSQRTVAYEYVPKAEADRRLEKVKPDLEKIRKWNIDSIHCLDAEDMVFSYWAEEKKDQKVRPVLTHVYSNGELKRLDITNLLRSSGFTPDEWSTVGSDKP